MEPPPPAHPPPPPPLQLPARGPLLLPSHCRAESSRPPPRPAPAPVPPATEPPAALPGRATGQAAERREAAAEVMTAGAGGAPTAAVRVAGAVAVGPDEAAAVTEGAATAAEGTAEAAAAGPESNGAAAAAAAAAPACAPTASSGASQPQKLPTTAEQVWRHMSCSSQGRESVTRPSLGHHRGMEQV